MSTATKMFLRYGYSGTSMKALANELGVSAPALYWYFPSKEDLYVEVIGSAMTDFFAYVAAAAESADPVERLDQMVRAHVEWQLNQADAARTFDLSRAQIDDVSAERLAPVVRLQINYRDSIRAVLEEGREAGAFTFDDVKVTAFAIITLCEYVHSWFNPAGPLTSSEVASQLSSLVHQMVGYHATTVRPAP